MSSLGLGSYLYVSFQVPVFVGLDIPSGRMGWTHRESVPFPFIENKISLQVCYYYAVFKAPFNEYSPNLGIVGSLEQVYSYS